MATTTGRVAPFVRSWLSGARVSVSWQLRPGALTCSGSGNCHALHTRVPLFSTPLGSRTYLSLQSSGVKTWEQNIAKGEGLDRSQAATRVTENITRCRYARASTVNKIFDNVTTPEELVEAEKVLLSFRRGLNSPRISLPMCVVRACIRVGKPRRALYFAMQKVQYGLFPSRKIYNILIDALLKEKDGKGAVLAYEQLLGDEIVPDGMTLFMATQAYALLDSPEKPGQLDKALELAKKCAQLAPPLGRKAHSTIIKTLLEKKAAHQALELLGGMEETQQISKQTALNLRVHALVGDSRLEDAIALLGDLTNPTHQDLGVPKLAISELEAAVTQSGQEKLSQAYKDTLDRLKAAGKLTTEDTS